MNLTALKLVNFRNYREVQIDFNAGTNVLFGKNGQGKTNILESVYYLALTKSFRNSSDQNLILYNENFFRIQGEFQTSQGRQGSTAIAYSTSEGKRLTHNRQRIQKFSDYIGTIPVVLLAPSDLQVSQGSPQLRRQFLDIMLSQASQLYLHHLVQYRRSLKQRNSLLQTEEQEPALLHSWEEALVQNGTVLIRKRLEAVAELDEIVKSHYRQLSGTADKTKIVYRSPVSLKSSEQIADSFREKLAGSRERDFHLGTTTVGPHRDDMLFLINGKPLRVVGSQGEHKTFVISLKMAEFRFLKNSQQEAPVYCLTTFSVNWMPTGLPI